MAVQIQFRRGTAAAWTSADPTLAAGELAIETDTDFYKIGDGSTAWTSLGYSSLPSGTAPLASPTFTGTVTMADLVVNGTTSTINSTTLTVDDKNIELGSVASPSDTTADGGGITLKGASDKTLNWVNSTDAWTSSEHIALATGKSVYIDGVLQLSKNAVAATVVLADGVVATTQAADNNTTLVAITAYVQTELGALSSDSITDADANTKIQVEESSDENIIRFDTAGTERMTISAAGVVATAGDLTVGGNATIQSLDMDTIVAGDVIYGSGADTLARLAKGTDTHVLTLASGVPTWAAGGSAVDDASAVLASQVFG